MTRNQIPGISATWRDELLPEASWGLGWDVQGNKKLLRGGSLLSPRTFGHGGAGGTRLWIDPAYDLVSLFFSVDPYETNSQENPRHHADHFINAVTAAVVDAE